MLITLRDNAGFLAQFFSDRVPGANFDPVLIRQESHQPKAIGTIVGKQFMHQVAVLTFDGLMQGLCATLVATADQEEIFLFAEAFFPHLLRRIAFWTMTLFP